MARAVIAEIALAAAEFSALCGTVDVLRMNCALALARVGGMQEAAQAYDAAARQHLGEDSRCNFARSDCSSDVQVLEVWESGKTLGVKRQRYGEQENGGETERENGGETCRADDGSKKQKHSPDADACQVNGAAKEPCAGPESKAVGEWSQAQWAAFRKRLAREKAAADETDASLRRSLLRSRC